MQIVSNLITNAVEAIAHAGVLNIKTREVREEGLEVLVRDKGRGNQRGESGSRIRPSFHHENFLWSAGIWLWVARQLLEKRGGSIRFQSSTEFPLNGTTVSVFIPFQA